MVCDWCGTYKARRISYNGHGNRRTTSESYEDKPIVEPSDLMTLAQSGEAILITPYGYCRVKKTPYYKDKYFKPIATEIKKHNDNVTSSSRYI